MATGAMQERSLLRNGGIVAMGIHEVESIYYSKPVLEAVAASQAQQLGKSPDDLLDAARTEALAALQENDVATRLAAIAAERVVRRLIRDATPNRSKIPNHGAQITVTVESPFALENERVQQLLSDKDLEALIADYSIRDSSLRGRVCRALGFSDIDVYEAAAKNSILRSADLAANVRALVGELPQRDA